MISRDSAKNLVASFSGMPFFPAVKEARIVLIDTVETALSDEPHAQRFKSEVLTFDRAPTVRDVRAVAQATATASAISEAVRGCKQCDWTGWDSFKKGGYSFSRRCKCTGLETPKAGPFPL